MAIYMPMGYLNRRSCRVCGKKFKPTSRSDQFCSIQCMRRRYDGKRLDFSTIEPPIVTQEQLIELGYAERVGLRVECGNARCRKIFAIGDRDDHKIDKRTRFCCAQCEKQFWRDKTRHPKPATEHRAQSL